ncbi:MAG TPA: Tm-1-like ATP-binding domain-containing protein [Urbifossiella sp.]|nr:Tm-1-like ATP-binding domain-containing protein [Urbifossiella sp.]
MAVLLIGTLDTKGAETAFVRDRLRAAGVPVAVLDAGVLGPPAFAPDIPRERVFAAAGAVYAEVKAAGDRGRAVTLAAAGAAELALHLFRDGKLAGVLGLGGSAGTTIATAAMRALPVGVPKLVVSTLASGQVGPFVGTRDVMMLHSVVDIAGLNRISRAVLGNAAAAMAGMVAAGLVLEARTGVSQVGGSALSFPPGESGRGPDDKPIIAATMFGVTTPCVEAARAVLEETGYEVLVFHATGTGGKTMEGLIRDGLVAGVLDITTTELADELAGGILSAGPDRLTAAGAAGIPQLISVGALDMVNFGPPETVPTRYADRRFYRHNANVTLMRTTPEENAALGAELARKAAAARGPTVVALPLRGVSAIDADGKPFWWPEADATLFAAVRAGRGAGAELLERDEHINDPAFAAACARSLLAMLAGRRAAP